MTDRLTARRCLVAPGTRGSVIDWLTEHACSVEWAPAPGGVAWWGSREPDHLLVASQPNRLGLKEDLPVGSEALIEVDARLTSLLDGGSTSTVWIEGDTVRTRFRYRPEPPALSLAQATDFLRRRISGLAGVTVVGEAPWLGAVPFLGGAVHTRLHPPIAGLPGLGVAVVLTSGRAALSSAATAVLAPTPPPSPPTGTDDLPKRRLADITLRIP